MIRWITELLNRWFELPFPASDPAWTLPSYPSMIPREDEANVSHGTPCMLRHPAIILGVIPERMRTLTSWSW